MSVHTLGNTSAPGAGANDTTENEVAPTLFPTQPSDGYITKLWGYVWATTGTIPLQLLLVGSGGSLILATSAQTVGTSPGWQSASITPTFIGAGNNQAPAWFIASGEMHFPVYSGGNFKIGNPGSPVGGSGLSNATGPFFSGNLGAYYEWIDPLTVSGVSPASATAGQSVTVSGSGFVGGSISSVTFNGIAASFTVNNDGSLSATVPSGFTSGTLTVTSDHGTGSTTFTEGPPTLTGVSPTTAGPGQSVTLSGSNFANGTVTGVSFNGTAASTFAVVNDTTLTATVPTGASTGSITVTTNHGSASISFTVSSAHLTRSGAEVASQGIFLTRSGGESQAQGVMRYLNGVWVNAQ